MGIFNRETIGYCDICGKPMKRDYRNYVSIAGANGYGFMLTGTGHNKCIDKAIPQSIVEKVRV